MLISPLYMGIRDKKTEHSSEEKKAPAIHGCALISQNLWILQELAPRKARLLVAGFHRACPSTALDELLLQLLS
ncbi:hypothetical protein ABE38_14485 [Brevibacillus agri]|nr:hypothetical protein D478_23468 [Brevibacillus agri BAB-2500]MBG9566593.1 hypothetical protein [Brevibacillus agri]